MKQLILYFIFWRHHSYFQTLAPLDKLLWQAANPECTIGVKQSHHHIFHNASRPIKELQMQHYWSKNRLQVAHWDGLHHALRWIGTSSLPENTHHDYFHVFLLKIKFSFKYLQRQPWWVCFIRLPTVIHRKFAGLPEALWTHPTPAQTPTTDYLSTITFVYFSQGSFVAQCERRSCTAVWWLRKPGTGICKNK